MSVHFILIRTGSEAVEMVVTMVHMVIFINLFFAPILPLYIIYKKRRKPLKPNLDLLFQYSIVAVCNIPLTKVFIFLAEKISKIYISIDSGYYTVAALLPTILPILLYKFYKTYPDHRRWKEKIIQRGVKGVITDLAPACILLFVSCFMLFVFEPILMYATNVNDFWFDFQIVIWPILRVFSRFFLIGIVIVFVIYNADLLISKRLFFYKGITLIGFIIFFLLYLQGNWLAGNLPPLNGEAIVWENYGRHENFVITTAVIILAITIGISIIRHGLNCTVFYITMCTAVIWVMLFSSLIPTMVADEALNSKDTFSATLKNFNSISSNKNFLIFLVDATDSKTFYDILMNDDDFRGMMDDFTYYPDTTSVYPWTLNSIPNILTGVVNYNKTLFLNHCANAYNQSPLFEKLTREGYGINLYSNEIRWSGARNYNIENSTSIYDISIDIDDFMEQELKYIKFKYLPYGMKQFSQIETLDFNSCKSMNAGDVGYTWGNLENYGRITEHGVLDKQSQNYFQFVHCEGSHNLFDMDKDLNIIEDGGTYEQKVGASLTMVKAYLQRLKDNDVYDNSVIVIMSDHGFETIYWEDTILDRFNPILFIKGIHEKHELLESDRSVSYVDLQDAFCDLIDGKQSTELFLDLDPGRTRTVLWYLYVNSHHMVEYSTTETASEAWKFTPTGNIYDSE